MKFFSISFTLQKDDYKFFNEVINKSLMVQRLKYTAIALAILLVFTVMNLYSLAVTAFFLLFILFFVADIINRIYFMKMNEKAKIGKRHTVIDFYDNHFEVIYLPDENFKGKSEKHYPLGAVKMVMENKRHIYFKLEDYSSIIIPKRMIDGESLSKIKNMIDNLYPDRFLEE